MSTEYSTVYEKVLTFKESVFISFVKEVPVFLGFSLELAGPELIHQSGVLAIQTLSLSDGVLRSFQRGLVLRHISCGFLSLLVVLVPVL